MNYKQLTENERYQIYAINKALNHAIIRFYNFWMPRLRAA